MLMVSIQICLTGYQIFLVNVHNLFTLEIPFQSFSSAQWSPSGLCHWSFAIFVIYDCTTFPVETKLSADDTKIYYTHSVHQSPVFTDSLSSFCDWSNNGNLLSLITNVITFVS